MGNKHKRFLTNYTHSKYFTPIIACLCFLAFASKAGAQSFSVPLLNFYEFGTELKEQDRAIVAYYMGQRKADERLRMYSGAGSDYTLKYNTIKREFGDSLLTLDNYGLCKAMCSIQENAGGVYMRSWDARNEEDETPALQRLYAYGIKNAKNRTDFIHFLVGYAERAPYDEERVIGEYLIRECSDELDDNLKYKAFEYAIYGILETIDIDDIRSAETAYGYCKDKLSLSQKLFGEEDIRYYHDLLFCADFACAPFINDREMIETLYGYHQKYDRAYRDGQIDNIFSDPLYRLYSTKIGEKDIDAAYKVLNILMSAADVDLTKYNSTNYNVSEYGESQIVLMYLKAQLDHWTGKDGYEDIMKAAYKLALKYLSPYGGFYGIQEYIRPDYRLLSDIIYWLKISYDSSDAGDVYDAALFLKGTVNNIASAVLTELDGSEDEELREYVDSLRNNYDKTPPWRNKRNPFDTFVSPDFQKWSARETKFSERLDSFGGPDNAVKIWESCLIKWQQVRNGLQEDETAIEIVNSIPLLGGDIEYKAIVLNSNDDTPVAVKLCTDSELKKIMRNGNCYDISSTKLFDTIWKPVAPYVKAKVIHYSPIGILSNINIAAIRDENGRCLSDTYDIRNCSSTGWLAGRSAQDTFAKYERIELWGGSHSIPETTKEIKEICTIARENGVAATAHSVEECTERSFRAVSGNHIPIIHIAAHGFYFRATEHCHDGTTKQAKDDGDNPLDRCGILLESETFKAGMHENNEADGVLLGSEIARMNLVGTELVVLSACKSGLGDISDEGIIGLQRAFRMAGAKTVIAALGNVPDKATRAFMTEFYRSLFAGKTKRQTFNDAVSFMKSSPDYSPPRNWAQFVMID